MITGTGGFSVIDIGAINRLHFYAALPDSYDDIVFKKVDGLLEAVQLAFTAGKPLLFTGIGEVIQGAEIIPQVAHEVYRRTVLDVNAYIVRLFYCHPDGSTRGGDVSLFVTEDGACFVSTYF